MAVARVSFLFALDSDDKASEAIASSLPAGLTRQVHKSEFVSIFALPEREIDWPDDRDEGLRRLQALKSLVLDEYVELGRVSEKRDWRFAGLLWPVIWLESDGADVPADLDGLEIELSWDRLILRNIDESSYIRACSVAGETWARRRTLKIILLQAQLLVERIGLRSSLPEERPSDGVRPEVERLKQSLLRNLVLVDARVDTFYAFEIDLIDQCYSKWSLRALEDAASTAVSALTELLGDLNQAHQELQATNQLHATRRLEWALLVLTVLSGAASIAAISEFIGTTTPWEPRLLPRGLISLLLVSIFIVLLVRYRTLVYRRKP